MCIIIYKPAGVEMPDAGRLATCFRGNPDGAGFMYPMHDKGLVRTRKGFMSFPTFMDALDKLDNVKEMPLVLHFRIKTQGNTDTANTHPFPVTENHEALIARSSVSKVAVAHNGIIDLTTSYTGYKTNNKEEYSDTYYFVRDYLTLIIKDVDWYKEKSALKLVARLADSKLAVLGADGHCQLVGTFHLDEDGCYYSNLGYNDAYSYYGTRSYTMSGGAIVRSSASGSEHREFLGFGTDEEMEDWLAEYDISEDEEREFMEMKRFTRISAAFVPSGFYIQDEDSGTMMPSDTGSFVHDKLGRVYEYDEKENVLHRLVGITSVDDNLNLCVADPATAVMFEIAE